MEPLALAALITVGTTFSVLLLPRMPARARPHPGWLRHPGTWLLIVTALLYLNQVLFTVYVTREWNGDVSRIARYVPDGWFALADLDWLAESFPAPGMLFWTVLRAQAVLELPFVLLAYLTICRWFGPDAYRRAVSVRWAVSASYTTTFCLIEWSLFNPYTMDDLVLRGLSGILVPALITRLGEGPASAGPLPLTVSVAAVGCLVLAVYDTALLYNLGHLRAWLPMMVGASAVLVAARWSARRQVARGPTAVAITNTSSWFLALFLVPALPLRYGLNFGSAAVSLLAGALLVGAAVFFGWPRSLLRELVVRLAAGVVGAIAGYSMARGFPEARLLAAAVGFLLTAVTTSAWLDRRQCASSS